MRALVPALLHARERVMPLFRRACANEFARLKGRGESEQASEQARQNIDEIIVEKILH